jgi:CBS domain containing-hemolysin-like protein
MDFQTGVFSFLFLLSIAFSAFFAGAETALVSLGRIVRQSMHRVGAVIRVVHRNRLPPRS